MMKILAPVATFEEACELIACGADELFCGFLPEEWKEKYSSLITSNDLEYRGASMSKWGELKKIARQACKNRKDVFLVLNRFFAQSQYKQIIDYTKKVLDFGIKGFIVADPNLMIFLKNKIPGIFINVSSINPVFNSEAVAFYRNLGVSRITLPQQLGLGEIKDLVNSNPDIEFEVFILNDASKNVDGLCTYQHGFEELKNPNTHELVYRNAACFLDYDIKMDKTRFGNPRGKGMIDKIATGFQLFGCVKNCGACAIKKFNDFGVMGIKISGREYPSSSKIRDVRFIKGLIDYIDTHNPGEAEFSGFAKDLFMRYYKMKCGESCYYEG